VRAPGAVGICQNSGPWNSVITRLVSSGDLPEAARFYFFSSA